MASADSVRDSGLSRPATGPHRRRTYPARTGSDGPADRPRKVSDVLADVGDDPAAARAALDQEKASPNPRSTLITALTATTRLATPGAGDGVGTAPDEAREPGQTSTTDAPTTAPADGANT